MSRPVKKQKYYVKCGQLEKWVMAWDELNAAVVTLMNAPGETMLDPYYFFVSKNYEPEASSLSPLRLDDPNYAPFKLVETDDVLEVCNMAVEEADEFYLKDMNNEEDDDYGWIDERSNEEF
jgi:hypothetical protein|tara:strand:- start:289 stop:651 length:363 start_codon:yes stop_codon:yes gene_type:complete